MGEVSRHGGFQGVGDGRREVNENMSRLTGAVGNGCVLEFWGGGSKGKKGGMEGRSTSKEYSTFTLLD